MTEVSRTEDMSHNGFMRLLIDDDGDVMLLAAESSNGSLVSLASVEFCEPSIGGGASPATHAALRVLAIAMQVDNGIAIDKERAEVYLRLLAQEIGDSEVSP